MQNTAQPLTPDTFYHIYNRANGSEKLFLSQENYRYFLEKYRQYISPVADTFCYCLMPNHFHLLVRIKPEEQLKEVLKARLDLQGLSRKNPLNLEGLVTQHFSNLFNAYSKAFNKLHNRKGSLFMHTYKRKAVSDRAYLLKLVHYIHHNPVAAKLCSQPQTWPHSSFTPLVDESHSFLLRQEVLSWFGDLDNFIYCHSQVPESSLIQSLHIA